MQSLLKPDSKLLFLRATGSRLTLRHTIALFIFGKTTLGNTTTFGFQFWFGMDKRFLGKSSNRGRPQFTLLR